MQLQRPALVVLSTLFPSEQEPVAGVFIKERMFRVAKRLPVTVISPQPWFPCQGLVRRWRPTYRPERVAFETSDGVEVYRPGFFALPGVLRRFDGFSVAVACWFLLRRLQRAGRADMLDVHFAYPDGFAGHLLAKWSGLPYVITLRGKEERLRRVEAFRIRMAAALKHATKVIAVSAALRQVGIELGARQDDSLLIGNGIDLDKFHPLPRDVSRRELGIAADAQVLVSVGGVGERKGFHRIIDCLPELVKQHPKLLLLIVGGPSPEGDWTERLRQMVRDKGLHDHVRLLGPMPPEALKVPLSAADVFVLATRYEGWANVFLEAMACRLPVVSTLVGGNDEVVCRAELGTLVAFGDELALTRAIHDSLINLWDRDAIQKYAQANTWDRRIDTLVSTFRGAHQSSKAPSIPEAV